MKKKYDFSGWATKNDLKCSDGRIIRHNAFKDDDGQIVPLVWNHQHDGVDNVLGHALLENRDEGVYTYCSFNDTEAGRIGKELVRNGDVKSLSIYANHLKQVGGDVIHGAIREVSLVLAGANPGAFIDSVIAHGETVDEETICFAMEDIVLYHNDSDEEEDEMANSNEPEEILEDSEEISHADESDETVKDVFNTLSDKQKNAVYAIIAAAVDNNNLEHADEETEDDEDSEGGNDEMKHNVFDQDEMTNDTLSHAEMETIISDAKKYGSLKESFLAHADEYGIKDINFLFPDAKNLTNQPGFIKRNPDAWVDVVMNGVHHTPFARIKMMFADLREDDARAKGYATKGKLKKEEVFGLVKRVVEPTTIYKKQKLDRDDIIDITDFDVVAWLKSEMRTMLDEEIARAILFGDGRSASSDDKIKEANIIPIVKDAALYALNVTPATNGAEDIIDAAVRGQNDYEGSGNTILFMGNSQVTEMLLIKDKDGHRMYKDLSEVALACAVNRIVKVPDSIVPSDILGLIVDLNDYNVGADKGGAVNMFDDFDIDVNQQKYLIETRCSGALTKPFSAIVIKKAVIGG